MGAPSGSGNAGVRSPVEAAVGVLLIVIGLAAAASWFVPDVGIYAPLVVGLALMAAFAYTRAYGFAVPAGIVTGVGVGVVITTSTTEEWGGGPFLLCLAAGFAAVWLLGTLAQPQERNAWPFIPAGIIGTVGLIAIFGDETNLPIAQLAVAVVLIVIGVSLILRGRALRT